MAKSSQRQPGHRALKNGKPNQLGKFKKWPVIEKIAIYLQIKAVNRKKSHLPEKSRLPAKKSRLPAKKPSTCQKAVYLPKKPLMI
jgi:hypothetical protein